MSEADHDESPIPDGEKGGSSLADVLFGGVKAKIEAQKQKIQSPDQGDPERIDAASAVDLWLKTLVVDIHAQDGTSQISEEQIAGLSEVASLTHTALRNGMLYFVVRSSTDKGPYVRVEKQNVKIPHPTQPDRGKIIVTAIGMSVPAGATVDSLLHGETGTQALDGLLDVFIAHNTMPEYSMAPPHGVTLNRVMPAGGAYTRGVIVRAPGWGDFPALPEAI